MTSFPSSLVAFASRFALFAVLPGIASCSLVVDTSEREPAGSSTEPLCTQHSECTERLGEPAACVDGKECVKLLDEDCLEVLPEGVLEDDDVLLFGYMGTIAGEFASYGIPTKEGAALAFREIETINGIPGVPGPGRRHIGMVACNHGADPVAVARHLIEEVKVPAILGASFSGVTLRIFDSVALPNQALILSHSATSPDLTFKTDDQGLLWRTAPSDVLQTRAMRSLLSELVRSLRKSGALEEDEAPKIALVVKGDSAGTGLRRAIMGEFDTAADEGLFAVEADVKPEYPNPDEFDVDWQDYIDQVLDAEPHIIIPLGTSEFVTEMMKELEDNWDPAHRPWYVLPEGDRVDELTELSDKNPSWELAGRVIGTAPGARQSRLYQAFEDHFESVYRRPPKNLAEYAYDGAYLLAYATAISQQQYPTGRELADSLKGVTCLDGPVVPVGPDGLSLHFSTAAREKCINFDGASGPLDFDNDVGEAPSDIAMWCLRKGEDGATFDPALHSYYSIEANAIVWHGGAPIDFSASDWCDQDPAD